MFNMDEHAKCENSLSEWQAGILKIFLRLVYMYPWVKRETQGAKFLSRQRGLTYLASNDQRLDNRIHWINLNPMDNAIIGFPY